MQDVCTVPAAELKRHQKALAASAYLVQIAPTGPRLGTRYQLGQAQITLGRSPDAQIVTDDTLTSRRHARIERLEDHSYKVVDLRSTNGTYVNDQRIQEVRLRDGDTILIGNHVFRFLTAKNVELRYHEELQQMSTVDPLTLVPNRRGLETALGSELARAARTASPLSVILFDVDHFKTINDELGHSAGDAVLRELTGRVEQVLRKSDTLARYGGDEFAVLLPTTPAALALGVAQRAGRAVADEPFRHPGGVVNVTISLGVAECLGWNETSSGELLTRADEMLYKAKRAGRNCVAMLGESADEPIIVSAKLT